VIRPTERIAHALARKISRRRLFQTNSANSNPFKAGPAHPDLVQAIAGSL